MPAAPRSSGAARNPLVRAPPRAQARRAGRRAVPARRARSSSRRRWAPASRSSRSPPRRAAWSAPGERLARELRGAGRSVRCLADDVLASLSETRDEPGTPGAGAAARVRRGARCFRGIAARARGRSGSRTPATSAACCARPRPRARRARTSPGHRRPVVLEGAARVDGQRLPPAACPRAGEPRRRSSGSRAQGVRRRGHGRRRRAAYDERWTCAGPCALVVGNEGAGLPTRAASPRATRASPSRSRAPVESLNVAVAAGVLLFEAARAATASRAGA